MGNLHNELKRSPIGDGLKRAIGQHKQGEGGLERYSETLQGIVDIFSQPEWSVLRGERLGALSMPATAVAAELCIVGLAIPPTANAIAVVEEVSGSALTAMSGGLTLDTHANLVATLTGAAPGTFRDKRFNGASTPGKLVIFTGSDPAGLATGILIESRSLLVVGTGALDDFKTLPVILRPGDAIAVVAGTVNVGMRINWKWRERAPFPGELT